MSKYKKIILLIIMFCLLTAPVILWAQTKTASPEIPLQVKIPIFSKPCTDTTKYPDRYCVSDFGDYIGKFYKYFSGVVGILAAAMIVFGGFQWVTAAGNASKIQNAKTTISGALIGLVLTLGAYVFLNTINPELVSLRFPYLSNISRQVLTTNFCKDLPKQSGLPVITDAESIPCGQYRGFDQSKATIKYAKDYCCGSKCPTENKTENKDDPEVCMVAPDASIESECPETCVSASSACKSADQNNCASVDSGLAANSDYTCRRENIDYRGDKCTFTSLVKNPCDINKGLTKVNCNYGVSAADKDTPCWDNNKPRSGYSSGNIPGVARTEYKCTSEERVGEDTDAWCCAYSLKNKIDCKLKTENCDEKDVQVACSPYNAQTGCGPACNYESTTDQTCDDSLGGLFKCCMQLEWTRIWK